MSDHRKASHFALWLVIAFASGCAHNVVHPMSESRATPRPPTIVLVYDPSISKADRGEREQTGKQAASVFAVEMVDGIRKLGLQAVRAGGTTPVPDDALLVIAQLVDVEEGSQVERVVVGFGAGASHIDARVQVYASHHGSRTKLLEFETHSDSGEMPGAAATMGAGVVVSGGVTATSRAASSAVGGVKVYRSAVDRMVAKSAEQATDYLSEYFGKHGWITQGRVHKATR